MHLDSHIIPETFGPPIPDKDLHTKYDKMGQGQLRQIMDCLAYSGFDESDPKAVRQYDRDMLSAIRAYNYIVDWDTSRGLDV